MTNTSKALKPILKFLQQYAPFSQMLPTHQEYLAMHLEQVFFAGKDEIITPHDGVVESLYIVKNGCISSNSKASSNKFEAGLCFPINALLNKRAVNAHYQAVNSSICYRLTQSHFEYLMQQSIIFHDFILNQ